MSAGVLRSSSIGRAKTMHIVIKIAVSMAERRMLAANECFIFSSSCEPKYRAVIAENPAVRACTAPTVSHIRLDVAPTAVYALGSSVRPTMTISAIL